MPICKDCKIWDDDQTHEICECGNLLQPCHDDIEILMSKIVNKKVTVFKIPSVSCN